MESEQKRHFNGLVDSCKHAHTLLAAHTDTHTHTHTQHPELVLVGYYTNPNVPHDPDGVALMWDLKFHKETPDYIFNCQVRSLVCNKLDDRSVN